MKFFGEYLVSKNICSAEALADVLVEQQSALPSVLKIVHEKKLIPADQILKALSVQAEKQIEFKRAMQETQVWTDAVENEVRKTLESVRVPIGHLLIKKGVTDLVTITKALDEFLSRIEAPPKAAIEAKSSVSQKKKIDPVLLDEFLNYVTTDKIAEMRGLFETLKNYHDDKDMSLPVLKDVVVTVHSIKGLMRCIQIASAEAMMNEVEKKIVYSIEQTQSGIVKENEATSKMALVMCDELLKLCQILKSEASDESWSSQWKGF